MGAGALRAARREPCLALGWARGDARRANREVARA